MDKNFLLTFFASAIGVGCASTEPVMLSNIQIQAVARAAEPTPPTASAPKEQIAISDKILFAAWSARILEASHDVLDKLAEDILAHPELKRIEIQGHTARTKQPERMIELSLRRSKSVRDYLIKKGIETARLEARGLGDTAPIADNESPEGREKNRRVEFVILELSESTPSNSLARK